MKVKTRVFLTALIMITALCSTSFFTRANVYASQGNIAVSSNSVTVGSQVTVNVSVTGDAEIGVVELWLNYDSSILEAVSGYDGGGGGKIRILSSDLTSFTITFNTIGVGTSAVSVDTSVTHVYNEHPDPDDDMKYTVSNGSVTVNAPKTYSSNNNLKSLVISPGSLSPEFSAGVTEYNVVVPEDCERLSVSATVEDSLASVSVTGTTMDYGDNKTYIKVTAENGSEKYYTLYVKREGEAPTEAPPIVITANINGTDYTANFDYSQNPLPEGFEETRYTYKDQEITVGKGISKDLIIMYMETGEGEEKTGGYYIYDEEKDTFYQMVNFNQPTAIYTLVEFEDGEVEIPEGYEESEEIIEGAARKVYTNADQTSYLIYLMNFNGECGWYRYDKQENTLQRYIVEVKEIEEETSTENEELESVKAELSEASQKAEEAEAKLALQKKESNKRAKELFYGVIVLAVLLILSVFVIIAIVLKIRSDKDDVDDEIITDEYYSDEPPLQDITKEIELAEQEISREVSQEMAEETKSESEPEIKSEVKFETKSDIKSEAKYETEYETKQEIESEVKFGIKPETKAPEVKPDLAPSTEDLVEDSDFIDMDEDN